MFLKESEIKVILENAFELLESTGVMVIGDEAIQLFKENNCKIDDNIIKIPRNIVESCIESTPSKWIIYDREGNERLFMGEGRTHYGTADVAIKSLDYKTGKLRDFTLNDSSLAAKLADGLPNIDFVCPFGTPQDIPQDTASTKAFAAMVKNTTKPVGFMTMDVKNQDSNIEIASIIRGGLDNLQKKPFIVPLLEPASPLMFNKEATEKVLSMAGKELPFFFCGCPHLGATSPVTLAGSMVQMIAETLSGLVLTQLRTKGTPVGMGSSIGLFDMFKGTLAFGNPEHAISTAAFVEIVKYLNIPCWSNGGSTHAKLPDQQAIIEVLVTCLLDNLVEADVMWDPGYLESGLISSYEMLVLIDEIIGFVRRIKRGIEVNDKTLVMNLLKDVGPAGNFLTTRHTTKNFRKELWFPTIMERFNYSDWEKDGGLTMQDRARSKIDKILSSHNPKLLPEKVLSDIDKHLKSI